MSVRNPIVLVLCTGNSCRSQMAEAFLRRYHGSVYEVQSAGMEPAAQVHPIAVAVMAEVGIDISHQRPKDSRQFLGRLPVRHILIVCDRASQTCPRIWPGTVSRTSISFDDPAEFTGTAEEVLDGFRRVRDEIDVAMRNWTPQLTGSK